MTRIKYGGAEGGRTPDLRIAKPDRRNRKYLNPLPTIRTEGCGAALTRVVVCGCLLVLAGCTQWKAMTPKERWTAVGVTVAAAAIVEAYNSDDELVVLPSPWREWTPPVRCAPAKCR